MGMGEGWVALFRAGRPTSDQGPQPKQPKRLGLGLGLGLGQSRASIN